MTIDWKKILTTSIFAYIISWTYFLVTLPVYIRIFGKVNGTIINYFISWGILLFTFSIIHRFWPDAVADDRTTLV